MMEVQILVKVFVGKYVENDSRFRLINNINHGVCYSRNIGLKMAEWGNI